MMNMTRPSQWKILFCLSTAIPLFLFIAPSAIAKGMRFQGTVTCSEQGDKDARPAHSILVAPKQFVNKSKLSDGQGLYIIDLPSTKFLDKTINIHFRNENADIGQQEEFINSGDTFRIKGKLVYFVTTGVVTEPCNVAENDPQEMQQQLALFTQEPEKASLLLDSTAAGGGVTVLASLPSFGGAAAGGPALPGGILTVTGISDSKAVAGQLSSVALSVKAISPGFNFSPTRNISDATFWNAAALALSMRRAVNVVSDFDEFSRLSFASTLGKRFGIGFGVIKLSQEDRRTATIDGNPADTRTQSFEFDELGIFVSGGMLLNPQSENPVSLGVTIKHLSQDLELAGVGDQVTNTGGPSDPNWEFSTIDESQTDLDLSLSYQASPQLNIGLTLMSLLGEELTGINGADLSQRMAGLGVSYKIGRTHLGAELIYRDDEGTDAAVGINVVPFNDALVSAGYDSSYKTTSLGLSYYWLSYTYNQNDLFDDAHMLGVDYRF